MRTGRHSPAGPARPEALERESGWVSAIQGVAAELEDLNRSTEKDFLSVGAKLMDFMSLARQISSDMSVLSDLIAGERGRSASAALVRIREDVQQMGGRMEQSGQALAAIKDLSGHVRQSFSKLRETVSIFRTLCTLTRAETARLSSDVSSFSDLADQVKPLSESIQSSGERVLAASSHLDHKVQEALRKAADLSAREVREVHSLISSVVEGLKSFEDGQQRALEASGRQAAQHREVCEAIEDLVRSIQFHDITRQQIEHVCQALRQICSEVSPGERAGSPVQPHACAVLTLESSQLDGAALTFVNSVEHMQRDLEDIGVRVADMAAASKNLMGLSEDENDSFFLRMEGCLTGILKALGRCASAETAIESTASELGETIRGMRQAVHEIRGVEIQIQRTAINANIGSAHIGEAGSALNVIADVMHRVALDSNGSTEAAAGALDSMRDAANCVAGGSRLAVSGGGAETDHATGETRQAILELHTSSERSFSRLKQIATLSAQLSDDIRSLRDSLSVGKLFHEVVARAQSELKRMGADASPAGSSSMPLDPTRHIQRFTKQYTMQSERDVHEAVSRGEASAPVALAVGPNAGTADGGLGDNVELF
ncbi:MAG TPA: methyl-accepting chemotaxis protein [Bryobacteraceae bacterium]|nr:methyl-accepting chemotaxis protein [Bryobacteraceae bacterium]